ncbi:MAG: hypothetical protein HRU00_17085 [Myxococcales bacterium]|nr:hypothetical protein [Myxococcales bacterium]
MSTFICAWCQAGEDAVPDPLPADAIVSHGMCASCCRLVFGFDPEEEAEGDELKPIPPTNDGGPDGR